MGPIERGFALRPKLISTLEFRMRMKAQGPKS